MLGNKVRDKGGIRAAEDRDDRVRRHIAGSMDIIIKQIAAAANQRVDARREALKLIRQRRDFRLDALCRLAHTADRGALDALDHDADELCAGLLHHLLDAADGTDRIELLCRRHIHGAAMDALRSTSKFRIISGKTVMPRSAIRGRVRVSRNDA